MGVSTLAIAYLVVAVGTDSHPGDPLFLSGLFFIFALAVAVVFSTVFMFAVAWVCGVLFGGGAKNN